VATSEDVRRAGSHFLGRDSPFVTRLVEAAALRPGETVLDAGAGAGSITTALSQAVGPQGRVIAVETDPQAVEALQRLGLANVTVVSGDVLKVNWPPLDALVANPPFRLVPALLRRLAKHGFGRAVLVVPQELADRLRAEPGGEAYGRLTIEAGLRMKAKLLFPIPRGAFDPPPAVPCCAVQLTPRQGEADDGLLEAILEDAWASRQRILRHSLSGLTRLGLAPQDVSEALDATNAQGRTATQVSPWEYGQLSKRLAEALRRRKDA
jgi:16S rRNA (adenine1518-N6/adenine1519-N6)-dimethyltransferase